jgi:hypothetical protein
MGALMSESIQETVPPLVLDYDSQWLSVDLSAEVDTWAAKAAAELFARDQTRPGRRETRRMTGLLSAAASIAGRLDDSMVTLLLCPAPSREVVAIVRLVAVELDDDQVSGGVDVGRRIVAPDELPSIEPVEVSEFATPAGPAVRSRARVAGPEPERAVSEWLNYAWVVPGYRYASLMTTAFVDLLQAGQWRPAIDALAAGVALETGSAGPH